MRRWSIRILIGLAALIILIVVVVQLVLWSQLPKDIVTKQIEHELGLRISCKRLTTSWLGRTTLSDVSLGLPLAEKSFLNVQTLKVKHSSIFGLILTRAISIDYIEIDKPDVVVLQNANGQWNLAEVVELLGRVGGGNTGAASASSGVPKLPNVRLIDGTVRVVDNAHHTATLSPVNVNGYAQGSLVWEYDLSVGDAISVVGKLAPGGNWQHELKLKAHHLDSLTRGWGIDSYGADVAATWDGQLSSDGGVSGTLNLDHATAVGVPGAGDIKASGTIGLDAGGGGGAVAPAAAPAVSMAPGAPPAPAITATTPSAPLVTIRPLKLDISTSLPTLPNLELAGGTLIDDDAGVHVRGVQMSALGGFALINASFNPATLAADVDTRWTGLSLSSNISHSGSLLASLRMPFQDHPEIKVELNSHGIASANKWDAQLQLSGAGQSWRNIDWVLRAPQLRYTGSETIEFTDLVGHVTQRLPTIELTSLTLPARPHLKSAGRIDLANKDWFFRLDAGGAPKAEGFVVPLDFNIDAAGNQDLYTLKSANVLVADTTLHATGLYDRRQPNPVSLTVTVTQPPELPPNAAIQGHLGGHLNISGKLFKGEYNFSNPELKIEGELTSSDLVVLGRPIGDFDGHLMGNVGSEWDTHLYTTQMMMFGGQWKLLVHRPTSDGGVEATLEVANLPVEQLAKLAGIQNMGGTITQGSWTLVVPASPRLDNITLSSSPTRIVALHGFNVTADTVELKPQLVDGLFSVDLGATCGQGTMRSRLTCDLLSPKHISADLQVDNWPYRAAPDSTASILASVKPSHFDLDLGQKSITGAIGASADILMGTTSLAHAELVASVQGRAITISRLSGKVLGGTFDGDTVVDLDNPLLASGQFRWFDVDAAAFVPLAPGALEGLGGVYSGTVTISPARDPRPYEPVRIDINIAADHAHFRSVRIGTHRLVAVHAVGYANLDRILLEHSDIDVAGGMAHLQARVSQGFSSEDIRLSFEDLQLDQLAHVLPQFKGKPMPGLLSGDIHLMGSGAATAKIEGSSELTLAAADLGNFGPIAALYNALHPGGGGGARNPQGTGEITVAYEQNAVRVTNFHYFNRGIDAHGIFNVGPSILTLPDTPLAGQVAGTAEPLSNTRLPFLSDFNDVFGAVQRNLTTIDITGTVGKPIYQLSTLNQIGNSLKELLVGSARSDNGG